MTTKTTGVAMVKGDLIVKNEIHSNTNMQSYPQLYRRSYRPTITHFLDSHKIGKVMQVEQDESFREYIQEYRALRDEFNSTISFVEFYNLKTRKKPRGFNRAFNRNFELQRMVGKLTIPNFNGTSGGIERAWVHKLDTYLQLNPIKEEYEINLATFHLGGESHEWWYHGLVTLGHASITSYMDFMQRLIK